MSVKQGIIVVVESYMRAMHVKNEMANFERKTGASVLVVPFMGAVVGFPADLIIFDAGLRLNNPNNWTGQERDWVEKVLWLRKRPGCVVLGI